MDRGSVAAQRLCDVLASIDEVGEAYVSWNAASPSWCSGPELTWLNDSFVPVEAAINRTRIPVLYESHTVYKAPPLCGLASFRHTVNSELNFLRCSPDSSTNAPYLETFWNEVLYALAHTGPVAALQTAKKRSVKDAAAMVHIAARNGRHWIRIMPLRSDALLREFREYDSMVSMTSPPREDEAILQNSIVYTAHELRMAARNGETIEIVLTRLNSGDTSATIDMDSYWSGSELARMKWRLYKISEYVQSMGLQITFGAHERMRLDAKIPRPPPAWQAPPTLFLNLDVSAMVALCSDLTHESHLHVHDHGNRALVMQQNHERQSPLSGLLMKTFHQPVQLVATRKAIEKFLSIVEQTASESEYARASWLLGSRHALRMGDPWDWLFPNAVRVLDENCKVHSGWEDVPYVHQLLDALAECHGYSRPKSLGSSPHTLDSIQEGLSKRITTLLAHSHGVHELLEKAGPMTGTPLNHSALWLIQPRSFVSKTPESLPILHTSRFSDLMRTTSLRRAHQRWLRVWNWLQGPRVPVQHTIRHYPWWPWKRLENAWMQWTKPLAWKVPPQWEVNSVPSNMEDIEMEPVSPFPGQSTIGERWWYKIEHDLRCNWLHWLVLCSVCVAWLFAFASLVHNTWFSSTVLTENGWETPESLACTSTKWGRNALCGLNGNDCKPFSNTSLVFRCPSGCETTTLLNPRTIGSDSYNYVPLVVGGGNSTPYRADSFICASALHAGVIGPKGGCGIARMMGTYTNFEGQQQNNIASFPFHGVFPSSFKFEKPMNTSHCTDDRWRMYTLNVVFLAFITFVLRPMPIFLFWVFSCVGFWHVNLVSELRDVPPPIGDAVGDFGPHLFVCFVIWHVVLQHVWYAFEHVPLEFGIAWLGLWWIGVLLDVVFANVPLQRLTYHDISQQPGAVTSIVIIVIVVVVLAINQVRVVRSVGLLPKYLALYIVFGIVLALCAAVPGEGLRLHHYVIALILLPGCAFPTRISLLCCAILFGMYINGVARWGFDGILQDNGVIQGDATGNSLLPSFSSSMTIDGVIKWNPIPAGQRNIWSAFNLLVDDVLRYEGPDTSYNLSSLFAEFRSQPSNLLSQQQIYETLQKSTHYLRLAYSSATETGDFTRAALASLNGSFIPPKTGRT